MKVSERGTRSQGVEGRLSLLAQEREGEFSIIAVAA